MIQLATGTRDARLDAIETDTGTAAKLEIYSGSMPANCAAATSGTKLAEFDLASGWAANASGGSKVLNNLPLSTTGGGGDMTRDNTAIASGQTVDVTGFTITDGNA